jgi:hypothetical protein
VVDRTVLYDDIATHRATTCTLCGTLLEVFSVECRSNGVATAAVLLCPPCQRLDKSGDVVVAKLEQRYDPGRWERAQQ